MSIEQIVATAGDGKLRDGSGASDELREFLSQVPTERLAAFATHCLEVAFSASGLVLQDIVNELGRRLEYKVENGRYQGTSAHIGFDGLWLAPEGSALLVEVKTSDTYRIALDRIAEYRQKLREASKVPSDTSILIVVGRKDTGELEAQVRGSRHAWDMRLISVDALVRLVSVKESTEAGVTAAKIRSILVPVEYTRLDGLVDVMFAAAKDVESISAPAESQSTDTKEEGSGWEFTDAKVIQAKRDRILAALSAREGTAFVKRSRATYWDTSHDLRVVSTISKRYEGSIPYWYAYHPAWDDFLAGGSKGFLALGGVDLNKAFVLPLDAIRAQLSQLSTTPATDGSAQYWHVKIVEPTPGAFALQLPKSGKSLPLAAHEVPI